MRFFHHDFAFDLSDEWWAEAGMTNFVRVDRAYRVDPQVLLGRTIYQVRIDEVEPVRRQLSHGVFNEDASTGMSAKDRVMSILRGFLIGAAFPPVEVIMLPPHAKYRYKLTHGAHRFYLSIAAGFTHVPAKDGFDPTTL